MRSQDSEICVIAYILINQHGKLDQLHDIVSKRGVDYTLFIQHLVNLGHLNSAVNMKIVDKELVVKIVQNLSTAARKV